MFLATIERSILVYYEVTKPRIWYLLAFTAFGGLVVASKGMPPAYIAALTLTSVTMGSAAANAITGYIDRDIDAIMERTKSRPIPSGRINPPEKALRFGLILAALSMVAAYLVSPLTSMLMLIGLLDNIVVYSLLLKRRNPLNIILGGVSGGMPALIGYSAVANTITLSSLLMAGLVIIWIPSHIWSLAIRLKDDYIRVGVPMLTVKVGESSASRLIAYTSLLLVAFSIALYATRTFGLIYLLSSVALGSVALLLAFQQLVKPTGEAAWRVFKFSGPYLAMLFIAMMVDSASG